ITNVASATCTENDANPANNVASAEVLVGLLGDVNGDGAVNVQDVFYLINYLFAGGPPPVGDRDVNRDAALNVQDVFFLINHLFAGGAAPPPLPQITVNLPGGVPLTLVRIPAGTFMMGSPESERGRYAGEGPQHEVTLTEDYYLGKTEVTQAQWQAVMGTPALVEQCGAVGVGPNYPVYCVSWNDVCGGITGSSCVPSSFIAKLNELLGTTKFRLPTEAEWERAARGGTTTEFSFAAPAGWDTMCGSFPEAAAYMSWCGTSSCLRHPVGLLQANPFGLDEMHGNQSEWVADWWGAYPASAVVNPTGPAMASFRVFRGGDSCYNARDCRSATRGAMDSAGRYMNTGFRLARSL
ncbi:MAG TPA: SUMF1/EgtB/PvdO family nonheme iron enzyme, partial [Thermoanaerobaculaceae bacterium]|nr:SUMF1/EgtB/PvdO family nonheme iron enzyme [Thermoanaerobaculaceae bacterium]